LTRIQNQWTIFSDYRDNLNGIQTPEKFVSALQSKEVQHMILEFKNMNLAEIGDIDEVVDKFSKIIEAATKKSLQPVTEKKESSSTSTVEV